MALLFQNVHLYDPLKVWNSQGSSFTVSLYSLSGSDGPLCLHLIRARRVIFDNFAHFTFIMIMCNFFFHHSHQWWFLIAAESWVSWLHLFMTKFDVAVCSRLPWGLAKWQESLEEDSQSAIYKATRPVYCIASHHEPRPDQLVQYHHISDSRQTFPGCSSRRTCLFEATHYSRPIIL